jgi:hypothetical protein
MFFKKRSVVVSLSAVARVTYRRLEVKNIINAAHEVETTLFNSQRQVEQRARRLEADDNNR